MYYWNYEVAIFQIVALLLLFELPSIVRRLARVAYTPIYFMFFPLGHSDRLYAEYFVEDYFYSGDSLSEQQLQSIRYRIMAIAAVSMFVSAVVAPVSVGFIGGVLFEPKAFYDFVFALLALKIILLTFSLYNFFMTTVGKTRVARLALPLLYLCYIAVIFVFLTDTFDWAKETLKTNSVSATLRLALSEVVFTNIWAFMIIPAVSAGIGFLIANPAIRAKNLAEINDDY